MGSSMPGALVRSRPCKTKAARRVSGLQGVVIVRTIVVDPTFESVTVLGIIVLIRIMLSFSLEVEIEGTWPWDRWRESGPKRAEPS